MKMEIGGFVLTKRSDQTNLAPLLGCFTYEKS